MQTNRWELISNNKPQTQEEILNILLDQREIDLNTPKPTADLIDTLDLNPACKCIANACTQKKHIVIHGDYDVDGITATTILWRTIYNDLNHQSVFPYIPNRFNEGYGLSEDSLTGIVKMLEDKNIDPKKDKPLLVTVDCGIVSHKEVEKAKNMGFEVVITDHHQPEEKLPKADAIAWTDKATGAGIAWLISQKLLKKDKYMGLAALGTICDLQPLTGFNRSIAKYGLEELNKNPVVGIKAITETAGTKGELESYHCGWVIGPRLNASGRLETAMDSLRLLCTDSSAQAKEISQNLDEINKQRQDKTLNSFKIAQIEIDQRKEIPNIILTAHKNYHEGIIGLVAGNLVREYNRPAIAIAIDSKNGIAKGSARSIKGISIVDTLRQYSGAFQGIGGHDMAAGFSIEIDQIEDLQSYLENINDWDENVFIKTQKIDMELPSSLINFETVDTINKLRPFGIGNFEPVFTTKNLEIFNITTFGRENNHVKFFLNDEQGNQFTGVMFNNPEIAETLNKGQKIDLAYALSKNIWKDRTFLDLKIKDIKV